MHTLAPEAYRNVRHLFPEPHLRPVINALIDGNSPGWLWAGSVDKPATAYLWDGSHCHYLLGAPDGPTFAAELAALIASDIAPQAAARGAGFAKIYYSEPAWEAQLAALFGGRPLRKAGRSFYEFHATAAPAWRAMLPAGCRIVAIDGDILEGRLLNSGYVTEEIGSCWPSLERFQRHGFGFCLLDGEQIACWCTAEYVSGLHCGIGIETLESYQRRGYATITGSAFVEHCLQNGIAPHWDAWTANAPSVRAAERIGFSKTAEYSVFITDLAEAA